MVEGVKDATSLITQALTYLIYRDAFFGTMFTIFLLIIIIAYFIKRFGNRDG